MPFMLRWVGMHCQRSLSSPEERPASHHCLSISLLPPVSLEGDTAIHSFQDKNTRSISPVHHRCCSSPLRLITGERVSVFPGKEGVICLVFHRLGLTFCLCLPLSIDILIFKQRMNMIFDLEVFEQLQCPLRNGLPSCVEYLDNWLTLV